MIPRPSSRTKKRLKRKLKASGMELGSNFQTSLENKQWAKMWSTISLSRWQIGHIGFIVHSSGTNSLWLVIYPGEDASRTVGFYEQYPIATRYAKGGLVPSTVGRDGYTEICMRMNQPVHHANILNRCYPMEFAELPGQWREARGLLTELPGLASWRGLCQICYCHHWQG